MRVHLALRLTSVALVVAMVGACAVSLKPRSMDCTLATIAGAGCASLPRSSSETDEAAKQFSPSPGKANVFIVRPSILGGRHLWIIELDAEHAGLIAEHSYLLLEVEPGPHEIAAITGENRHALTVNASLGENIFLEVTSKMGWIESRAELRALPLEQGRALVRGASRVPGAAIR